MNMIPLPSKPGDADFFWPTVGRPGRVPLWALAPDPEQPRKHFDLDELNELAATMKPSEGNEGGQREIATVRELTPEEVESSRFGRARYLIKSGERRWRAAAIAELPDLEIRVKSYATKGQEKLDTWMLNGWRVGLSDIEDAYAIDEIAKEHGWKHQTEIAAGIRRDQVWVSQRLALLKTTPAVQARLYPGEHQFKLATGLFFSRLAPEKQDEYLAEMPAECRTSAAQVNWLTKRVRSDGVELPKRTRAPRKVREALKFLVSSLEEKLEAFSLAEDFERLFEHASKAQKLELVGGMKKTSRAFFELADRVEALAQGAGTAVTVATVVKPPPTPLPAASRKLEPAEVVSRLKARSEPRPVAPRPAASRVRRDVIAEENLPSHLVTPSGDERIERAQQVAPSYGQSARAQAIARDWKQKGTVTVRRWYEGVRTCRVDVVELRTYVQYWDEGLLEFQKNGTPKPPDIPDRAEVAEFLNLDEDE
jgi:ParB/RepB/Spo0J family partition protein